MFVANSFPRKRTFPYVDERLLANQGFESPYLQSSLVAKAAFHLATNTAASPGRAEAPPAEVIRPQIAASEIS